MVRIGVSWRCSRFSVIDDEITEDLLDVVVAESVCLPLRRVAAKMTAVDSVDVVLANNDRVTLRVGDTFVKVDADQARTLLGSAQYQGQTPGEFAVTGVLVINFILQISGATAPESFDEWADLLPPDGPYVYTHTR